MPPFQPLLHRFHLLLQHLPCLPRLTKHHHHHRQPRLHFPTSSYSALPAQIIAVHDVITRRVLALECEAKVLPFTPSIFGGVQVVQPLLHTVSMSHKHFYPAAATDLFSHCVPLLVPLFVAPDIVLSNKNIDNQIRSAYDSQLTITATICEKTG
jgi:hypothetical protein